MAVPQEKTLEELVSAATDIRDIKGPIDLPSALGWLLIFLAVILAVLATAFLIRYLLDKGKRYHGGPVKLPHEIAFEKLEDLKKKKLIAQGKIKEFYFVLSDITRHYLEDRFKMKAPEMTTEEFLRVLKDSNELTGHHKGLLKDFMQHCDLVKFAKYGPSEKEIESSFDSAYKLVEQTSQAESGGAK